MKAELDEMTSIIMEYDTADYGGFTFTNVKEIAERYARLQIEKDRKEVKRLMNGFLQDFEGMGEELEEIIDLTPIVLD